MAIDGKRAVEGIEGIREARGLYRGQRAIEGTEVHREDRVL
jgi:hypothetical protein